MNEGGVYLSIQRWSRSAIEALSGRASGIILGDLFCQKRMFENELYDVISLAEFASDIGLEVIFQTPVYNTTRTMEPTMALVRKLVTDGLLNAVLVHDIGAVQALREFKEVELWWDRFSFNRDFVPNAPLMEFLRGQGISRVEVIHPVHIPLVADQGLGVLLYGYGPEIASFGRICYTEYFLNEPCERKILCQRSRPVIASVDKVPLQYVADGYTLIDRNDPMVRLPAIEPALASRIMGLTAYLRGPEEIDSLDERVRTLWSSGDPVPSE
jgi:hypothetical protein